MLGLRDYEPHIGLPQARRKWQVSPARAMVSCWHAGSHGDQASVQGSMQGRQGGWCGSRLTSDRTTRTSSLLARGPPSPGSNRWTTFTAVRREAMKSSVIFWVLETSPSCGTLPPPTLPKKIANSLANYLQSINSLPNSELCGK